MLKVDLHLHTSDDPSDLIGHDAVTLIDRAAQLRFGALAITLHERQFADRRLTDYARERGIVLLPGIERTVEGRHVLLISFPAAEAEGVRSFRDLAKLKRRHDGVVIAPHAFFPARSCLRSLTERHADLFDAIEWSYFWTTWLNFNAPAARWAARHGKPLVGNSDLHDMRQFGRTHSRVFSEPDADAICGAIRAGRIALQTEPVPLPELVSVVAGMLGRDREREATGARGAVRSGSDPRAGLARSLP